MDINKIISIVRYLKEDGAIANVVGTGGLTGSSTPPGRMDGYDKVMGLVKRNKKYLYGGKGSRKMWMPKNVQ